jgi:hypothetical protein
MLDPTLGFPAPVAPETCPMPTAGWWPAAQLEPKPAGLASAASSDHQGPVTLPQTQTLWRSSQDNVELMTQKEVLNFKPAPRLEQIGDKCSKQVDDRKHRIG